MREKEVKWRLQWRPEIRLLIENDSLLKQWKCIIDVCLFSHLSIITCTLSHGIERKFLLVKSFTVFASFRCEINSQNLSALHLIGNLEKLIIKINGFIRKSRRNFEIFNDFYKSFDNFYFKILKNR